jgi:dTDP-4-dehydrorhamnose 3,5-epimerase
VILHSTRVHGAFLIEPATAADDRGSFTEVYQLRELAERGWRGTFVRSAISHNHQRGTLRGMHFQRAPHGEGKLVRCQRGAMFDVIVDVREASPTRAQWFGIELTPSNHTQLFIPDGLAHGFQTLAPDTEVHYQMTTPYVPEAATGVRWDDPAFGIDWPEAPAQGRTIAEKDLAWPDFAP